MVDVLVTCPKRLGKRYFNLKTLRSVDTNFDVYWTFGVMPNKLEVGDKLYVVFMGKVRGYFAVLDVIPENNTVIIADWVHFHEPPAKKGFRGFRYMPPIEKQKLGLEIE